MEYFFGTSWQFTGYCVNNLAATVLPSGAKQEAGGLLMHQQ